MENKDITAKWARETATQKLGIKVQAELTQCLQAIEEAVNSNKMETNVGIYIQNLTKEELERRGFTVKTISDQRDGSFTTISW